METATEISNKRPRGRPRSLIARKRIHVFVDANVAAILRRYPRFTRSKIVEAAIKARLTSMGMQV